MCDLIEMKAFGFCGGSREKGPPLPYQHQPINFIYTFNFVYFYSLYCKYIFECKFYIV